MARTLSRMGPSQDSKSLFAAANEPVSLPSPSPGSPHGPGLHWGVGNNSPSVAFHPASRFALSRACPHRLITQPQWHGRAQSLSGRWLGAGRDTEAPMPQGTAWVSWLPGSTLLTREAGVG